MDKNSGCRTGTVIAGAVALTLITAVATFFISSAMFPKWKCGNVEIGTPSFPKDAPVYHDVDRMEVPEKNLVISRPVGNKHCYILPQRSTEHDSNEPRALVVIKDPLTFQMIEHLAGSDAAAFCNGYETFLVRELKQDEAEATNRRRRDAGYGGGAPPPPPPAPAGTSAPAPPPPAPVATSAPAPPPPAPAATSAPAPPPPAPVATSAPAPPPPAPVATSAPAPPPAPIAPAPAPSGYGGAGGAAGAAAGPAAAAGAAAAGPAAANAGGVKAGEGGSAAAALAPLQGSAWQGEGLFASAKDSGKSAMALDIAQREPRCTDVLLDCVDHVGQVQSCYTWANGVLWMDRKCTDSKQFVIRMTKPPGRILKIAQQQWIICLKRRNEGLRC